MLRHSGTTLAALTATALLVALGGPASATPLAAGSADAGDGTTAASRFSWGTPSEGDEFEGSSLDQSAWEVYAGAGNAGAGLRRASQVTVADGVLRIDGNAAGTTGGLSYRSSHHYGRWETRMKVPSGDVRYHPVLLLWPTAVPWPQGGEIDYSETTAAAKDTNFFLHYSAQNKQTYANTDVDLTQWHNYAVEWTSAGVVGYVDGVEFFRDTDPAHQPPAEMHSSIQLDWFPNGTSATTPSSLQVDWQRYYPL